MPAYHLPSAACVAVSWKSVHNQSSSTCCGHAVSLCVLLQAKRRPASLLHIQKALQRPQDSLDGFCAGTHALAADNHASLGRRLGAGRLSQHSRNRPTARASLTTPTTRTPSPSSGQTECAGDCLVGWCGEQSAVATPAATWASPWQCGAFWSPSWHPKDIAKRWAPMVTQLDMQLRASGSHGCFASCQQRP